MPVYGCQAFYPNFSSVQPHNLCLHISRYPHKPASLWYSRVIPTPWSSILQKQPQTSCLFPHPSIPPDALELYQVSYVLPENQLPSSQTLCYLNVLSDISVAFRPTSVREALSQALYTRFGIWRYSEILSLSKVFVKLFFHKMRKKKWNLNFSSSSHKKLTTISKNIFWHKKVCWFDNFMFNNLFWLTYCIILFNVCQYFFQNILKKFTRYPKTFNKTSRPNFTNSLSNVATPSTLNVP